MCSTELIGKFNRATSGGSHVCAQGWPLPYKLFHSEFSHPKISNGAVGSLTWLISYAHHCESCIIIEAGSLHHNQLFGSWTNGPYQHCNLHVPWMFCYFFSLFLNCRKCFWIVFLSLWKVIGVFLFVLRGWDASGAAVRVNLPSR